MVGIGGGIPSKEHDIRLGDVVVATPSGAHRGVIQYDKGKSLDGVGFIIKGQLNQPPNVVLTGLNNLKARHRMGRSKLKIYMEEALQRVPEMADGPEGFTLPIKPDVLYCAGCGSPVDAPSAECKKKHITRPSRKTPLSVHYGTIASGNTVVKNAALRDQLLQDHHALCVEVEAAGLMNNLPCVVVRGVSDYADKHKNEDWQRYAALTAAAYMKELLFYVSPSHTKGEKTIKDALGTLDEIRQNGLRQIAAMEELKQQEGQHKKKKEMDQCLQTFKGTPYEEQKNHNDDRVARTCQRILEQPQFVRWSANAYHDLLWLSADPGCGKSMLAKWLVDEKLEAIHNLSVCYFFFKDNGYQNNLSTALCSILHQIFSQQRHLLEYALPLYEKSGMQIVEDLSELWRILLSAARASTRDVTCVIDGLDECLSDDRNRLIHLLSNFYTNPTVPGSLPRCRLKFFITSRPYKDIKIQFQARFANLREIHLRREDAADDLRDEIDLVVHERVEAFAKEVTLDDETKKSLLATLLRMEHRTYLWLHLAIKSISREYTNSVDPKETVVNLIPKNVDEAYEKILAHVSTDRSSMVKIILQVIVGAYEPLTLQQMMVILRMVADGKQWNGNPLMEEASRLAEFIKEWCGLFVCINHGEFYLLHQTAKEFLIRSEICTTHSSGWKQSLYTGEIESVMANSCIQLLVSKAASMMGSELLTERGRKCDINQLQASDRKSSASTVRALLDTKISCQMGYAWTHWADHLRAADLPSMELLSICKSPIYDCLSWIYLVRNITNDVLLWTRDSTLPWSVAHFTKQIESYQMLKPSRIYLAALQDHDRAVAALLEEDTAFDLNQLNDQNATLLATAASFGAVKVVGMLLSCGAKPGVAGEARPALNEACRNGYKEIVTVLLRNGAHPKGSEGEFAIQATVNGVLTMSKVEARKALEDARSIIQLLLEHGACIDVCSIENPPVLIMAIEGDDEELVRMLLELGADYRCRDKNGISPMLHAARKKDFIIAYDLMTTESLNGEADRWYESINDASSECRSALNQLFGRITISAADLSEKITVILRHVVAALEALLFLVETCDYRCGVDASVAVSVDSVLRACESLLKYCERNVLEVESFKDVMFKYALQLRDGEPSVDVGDLVKRLITYGISDVKLMQTYLAAYEIFLVDRGKNIAKHEQEVKESEAEKNQNQEDKEEEVDSNEDCVEKEEKVTMPANFEHNTIKLLRPPVFHHHSRFTPISPTIQRPFTTAIPKVDNRMERVRWYVEMRSRTKENDSILDFDSSLHLIPPPRLHGGWMSKMRLKYMRALDEQDKLRSSVTDPTSSCQGLDVDLRVVPR